MARAYEWEVTFEITHQNGRYLHPTERRQDTERVIIDARVYDYAWPAITSFTTPYTQRLKEAIEFTLRPQGRRVLSCKRKKEVTA